MLLCLVQSTVSFGGAETLVLRIARWMRERGYSIAICAKSRGNEEIECELRKIGANVYEYTEGNLSTIRKMVNKLEEICDDVAFMHFDSNSFYQFEAAGIGRHHKNVTYVIHPDQMNYTFLSGMAFIRRQRLKMLKGMISAGKIFFMDEITADSFKKFYNLSCKLPDKLILRLPMHITDDIKAVQNPRPYEYDICALARAEFPFKGFLLGILKNIDAEKNNLGMLIISNGPDLPILKDAVLNARKATGVRIDLIGWVPYKELAGQLQRAKVIVGMGTTVLDAANAYRPCVLARYYSNDFYSAGLFHDNISMQGSDTATTEGYRDVNSILAMDEEHYQAVCEACHAALKANYDENEIIPRLLRLIQSSMVGRLRLDEKILMRAISLKRRIVSITNRRTLIDKRKA